MKEMNKCFSFHQSQPSTSLCSHCCTVRGRHFPSISPSPVQTFTILSCSKISFKVIQKAQQSVTSDRWKAVCSVKSVSTLHINLSQKRGGRKKKWMSRHFTSCSHPANNDSTRNKRIVSVKSKKRENRKVEFSM